MGREWLMAQANITTPAGTPVTAPQRFLIIDADIYVSWIRWRFPPGPASTLNIAFYHGNAQIVPWAGQGLWIYGDDENETADVDADVFGGLYLVSYNTGVYPHTILVSVQYQPISVTQAGITPALPLVNRLYSSEVLGFPELVSADSEQALTVAIPNS